MPIGLFGYYGLSNTNDIVQPVKVSAQYAGIYCRRLLGAEMIEIPYSAHVDFAVPYLRDHAVVDRLIGRKDSSEPLSFPCMCIANAS